VAKPIWERIRAAEHGSARLKDVRETLAASEAAIGSARAAKASAEEIILNPSSSEEEVEQAQLDAQAHDLEARRLDRAIEQILRPRIGQIEADERYAQRRQRYDAAKAARDVLQRQVAERVPLMFAELRRLADEIEENDDLLKAINQDLPRGADRLESAEVLGRGLATGFYDVGGHVSRLTGIKLPNFAGSGHMRSSRQRREAEIAASTYAAAHRQQLAQIEANRPENIAKRAAADDARYQRYQVQQEVYKGHPVDGLHHRRGTTAIYHFNPERPQVFEMTKEQVAAARAGGFRVEQVAEEQVSA
jgi:hypothetical protein